MRPLLALTLVSFIAAVPPPFEERLPSVIALPQLKSEVEEAPIIGGFRSSRKGCGLALPRPLPVEADAIVRIRLAGQSVSVEEARDDYVIQTEHEGVLVEVYKAHRRLGPLNAVQTFVQWGGNIPFGAWRDTHRINGLDPVGSEWIVFLVWDARLNRFNVLAGPHGVVEIDGDVVRPLGILKDQWEGKTLEEFEAHLTTASQSGQLSKPPAL